MFDKQLVITYNIPVSSEMKGDYKKMPRQNRYSSQSTSRKEGNYRYDAKPVYLQREGGNTYQNQNPSNNGMPNDYGRQQPTSYGVDYSRNPRLYPRNDEFNRGYEQPRTNPYRQTNDYYPDNQPMYNNHSRMNNDKQLSGQNHRKENSRQVSEKEPVKNLKSAKQKTNKKPKPAKKKKQGFKLMKKKDESQIKGENRNKASKTKTKIKLGNKAKTLAVALAIAVAGVGGVTFIGRDKSFTKVCESTTDYNKGIGYTFYVGHDGKTIDTIEKDDTVSLDFIKKNLGKENAEQILEEYKKKTQQTYKDTVEKYSKYDFFDSSIKVSKDKIAVKYRIRVADESFNYKKNKTILDEFGMTYFYNADKKQFVYDEDAFLSDKIPLGSIENVECHYSSKTIKVKNIDKDKGD